MLDDDLLEAFIHTFYGHGDYDAPFWFVGMEEGLGRGGVDEVRRRLQTWKERGKRELEDLAEWHLAAGYDRFFTGRASLQPTWNPLMRILLSAEGESITLAVLRNYQKERLGRYGGESCLLELFPLPSPSTGHWLYGKHSHLPELAGRERYYETIAPERVRHLHSRILVHRPRAVIFYSTNARYRRWWKKIARTEFEQVGKQPLYRGKKGTTHFIICRHPVSHGIRNDYFHQIGKLLSS